MSTSPGMRRTTETRGIRFALASYIGLVVLQLGAHTVTGLLMLLAQAMEMLSDVLISAFLLLSISWSRKPPDETYMFGRGRAQNVAAFVSGTILISFISLETFREAVPKLFQTAKASKPMDTITAAIVMLIGITVIAIPIIDLSRNKRKGASAKAQVIALAKDEFSYVVGLVSVGLIAQGHGWADPAASVIVASFIAVSGVYLFRENARYLVGKAPSGLFREKIEATARGVAGVLGVHDLVAEYVGPDAVHAGLHIEVARGTLIEEADAIAEEVRERISRETGCKHCVVHIDPAK